MLVTNACVKRVCERFPWLAQFHPETATIITVRRADNKLEELRPKKMPLPLRGAWNGEKWEYRPTPGELLFPCSGEILVLNESGHVIGETRPKWDTPPHQTETLADTLSRMGAASAHARFVVEIDYPTRKVQKELLTRVRSLTIFVLSQQWLRKHCP